MNKYFFKLLLALVFAFKASCQNISCITIYSLPFNMETTLSVSEYDIIHSFQGVSIKKVFVDSESFRGFPIIKPVDLSQSKHGCLSGDCIDARMVIIYEYCGNLKNTFVIGQNFETIYNNKVYTLPQNIKEAIKAYNKLLHKNLLQNFR